MYKLHVISADVADDITACVSPCNGVNTLPVVHMWHMIRASLVVKHPLRA